MKRIREAERTNGQGQSASKTVTLGHAKSDTKTELSSESSKNEAAVGTGELPEWVSETPFPCQYELDMWQTDGDTVEKILLTRREYKKLKGHLAKLRGLILPDACASAGTKAGLSEPAESAHAAAGPQRKQWEREFKSDGERLSAQSLIEDVQDQCQEFLKHANYLDLRLLYEVLQYHSCNTIPWQQDESGLADAFMTELGLEAPAAEGARATE